MKAPPVPLLPTAPEERFQVLDLLRGFALLGILVVNMGFYSQPIVAGMVAMMGEGGEAGSGADRVAVQLVRWLAEGKFYALFSLVFGAGLFVQMGRVQARGGGFVRLYARRLAVLAVIGVLHALLLWSGDILLTYALAGFVLLLFRRRRDRTLLLWTLALLLAPMVYRTVHGVLIPLLHGALDATAPVSRSGRLAPLLAQAWQAYGQGSFAEVTRQRARDAVLLLPSSLSMLPGMLGMALIGLRLARSGLPYDLGRYRAGLLRAFALCVPFGLAVSGLYVLGRGWHTALGRVAVDVGVSVGGPVLCLGYASGLALISTGRPGPRWLAPLAAAGRMPLTNYLLQSLVCTTLFYGYGLGLLGRIGPAGGVVLAIVIWLLQLAGSGFWLARFRHGPAEWLWRWLTYGRPLPFARDRLISAGCTPPAPGPARR